MFCLFLLIVALVRVLPALLITFFLFFMIAVIVRKISKHGGKDNDDAKKTHQDIPFSTAWNYVCSDDYAAEKRNAKVRRDHMIQNLYEINDSLPANMRYITETAMYYVYTDQPDKAQKWLDSQGIDTDLSRAAEGDYQWKNRF